ncbi:UvrD-helicase domain-containing protein [Sediminispirochaeta smaragdinae]|uniref:DNA 3'-5' helicase n=1 Tax=Sediminispirochaeta smaragdinae (strain DSM 11293 / JCM 15392 / SEBR 4228) TaxID=573413 RepID=E1R784_SEDSS|nr:UvrD-helicase domain-containing protein [Sediminispirochaeta smaragdinae]ADK82589.1 UvrD/REP helicase [Sediminispirochaeta smaragdinae DSM 11293]
MRFIGDFHIHSSYSRATSRQLNPENLDLWGRIKGISVVGTGDFTHPGWVAELKEKLEPAEPGLFRLKNEYRLGGEEAGLVLSGAEGEAASCRFLLTAEISSIYKYDDRVRKVHNVIFAPDVPTVERIQEKIERLGGNIRSDGRPILGLDSRDLLELCLEANDRIFFVPAHIWTPWFSALGSKSGFDSIRACYRDLSDHISAVETGLSSDPPMNWSCSFLDEYTLISNSDAHSPEKLGREANLFDTGLSYDEIIEAMRGGGKAGFRGTIEFFPQEGKYHFDGHRKCGVSWDPLQTLHHGGRCPVCGRPVTVGVLNRVAQLADRKEPLNRPNRDPFYSLIPLKEVIAELEGLGPGSKKVGRRYVDCLNHLGSELDILLYKEIEEIRTLAGPDLAEAVERMRQRQVLALPGFDGEYGRIKIWNPGEKPPVEGDALSLFGKREAPSPPDTLGLIEFDLAAFQEEKKMTMEAADPETHNLPHAQAKSSSSSSLSEGLNLQQQAAADYCGGPSLIIAGPGTGKTRTLIEKVTRLIHGGVVPSSIVAVTFANKAAGEVADRLRSAGITVNSSLSEADGVRVFTFHSLGLAIVKPHLALLEREGDFLIIDDEEKMALLKSKSDLSIRERKNLIGYISRVKNGILPEPEVSSDDFAGFHLYQGLLQRHNCLDYDDLLYLPLRLFEAHPDIMDSVREGFRHIIVDEYQDINPVQYELLRILTKGAEFCAVGDPNQSIYGFRGGSPEFIRRFAVDFSAAKLFSLSRSYRCPDTVLKASSQLLGGGAPLLAGPRPGVKIAVRKTATAASEAEQIARDIEERSGGMGFFSLDSGVAGAGSDGEIALSDIAVLCRTSMQMPILEKAFTDHRIPFRTIRTDSLFSGEPYRTFLNWIRFLAYGERATLFSSDIERISRAATGAAEPPSTLRAALECFSDSNLLEEKVDIEEVENELTRYWAPGGDAKAFVEASHLASGSDRYDARFQAVSIMTIHAAKGLEFDLVFIPGCEDSIIPCTLVGEKSEDVEEERRLLYVAMTRARQELLLSYAAKRTIFGKTVVQKESPFLTAIEEALFDRREAAAHRKDTADDDQLSLFD